MNNFVKMDVAIELMADKISKTTQKFELTNKIEYQKELNNLIEERNRIYNGDIVTIDKVINTYGAEYNWNNKRIRYKKTIYRFIQV